MIFAVFVMLSDAAAAYAYRDHAQLQLIGKHFESGNMFFGLLLYPLSQNETKRTEVYAVHWPIIKIIHFTVRLTLNL